MDQNVIRITKLYYRSSLLSSILSVTSEDMTKFLKSLTIKDAILNLSIAWNRLEVDTIRKCWKNILNFDENDDDSDLEENIPLSVLKEKYQNREKESLKEVETLLTEVNNQVKNFVQFLENHSS